MASLYGLRKSQDPSLLYAIRESLAKLGRVGKHVHQKKNIPIVELNQNLKSFSFDSTLIECLFKANLSALVFQVLS